MISAGAKLMGIEQALAERPEVTRGESLDRVASGDLRRLQFVPQRTGDVDISSASALAIRKTYPQSLA